MIKAKHIERVELLYLYELPPDDQAYFDSFHADGLFFMYRNISYSFNEVTLINDPVWHGSFGLTNTSSLVVRLCKDTDFIIVGLVY